MTRASIRSRFNGPTNTKSSRVTVSDDGAFSEKPRRITFHWDYGMNPTENHFHAAQIWLDKFNPGNKIVGPGLAFDGDYFWTWEGQA
jgi:hypothetical protein